MPLVSQLYLLPLSPLIVAGPGQVLDWSGDRLELVLQDVLLVDGVPDPHLPGLVSGGDIESTRTVLGHVDLEILGGEPSQSWEEVYSPGSCAGCRCPISGDWPGYG